MPKERVIGRKKGENILVLLFFSLICLVNHNCVTARKGLSEGTHLVKSLFEDERDGNVYTTIQVKDQLWMVENLRFKTDSGCYSYKSKEKFNEKQGYYYEASVLDSAIPEGWEIPSEEDYIELVLALTDSEQYNPSLAYNALTSKSNEMHFSKNHILYPQDESVFKSNWPGRFVMLWTQRAEEQKTQSSKTAFSINHFFKRTGFRSMKPGAAIPVRCIKRINAE